MSRQIQKGGRGSDSRVVSNTNYRKPEPNPRVVTPEAAAQVGRAAAFTKAPLYSGKGYSTPLGPRPTVAGPGGGRKVYSQGSQCSCPSRPMGPGKDHFDE
jgi:hypothetical protein